MYEDGFAAITNIDYAAPVIEQMAARHRDKKGLTWQVMDATSLGFADSSCDCIIDKGTLDSVLCGESSTANASRVLSGASRARTLRCGSRLLNCTARRVLSR